MWPDSMWTPEDEYEYESSDAPTPFNLPDPVPMVPPPILEEESDVPVAITEDSAVVTSDLVNVKSVVAVRTGYKHDKQFSRHLADVPGLIILPITAVTYLRAPAGDHRKNPQLLLYFWDPVNVDKYPNFNACLDFFAQNK